MKTGVRQCLLQDNITALKEKAKGKGCSVVWGFNILGPIFKEIRADQ